MRDKRAARTGAVFAAVLTAALLLPAPAMAAKQAACGGRDNFMMETITPVTLHVKIGPFKESYARGETVKVPVLVTRPAEEDPLGLGVSYERPVAEPAEDVNVGVGISVGRSFLPGFGITNAEGKTTVLVRIERYVSAPKVAHVRAYAYKEVVYTTCLIVEETGYRDQPNAFKVTP
jgi:hypothetical protein